MDYLPLPLDLMHSHYSAVALSTSPSQSRGQHSLPPRTHPRAAGWPVEGVRTVGVPRGVNSLLRPRHLSDQTLEKQWRKHSPSQTLENSFFPKRFLLFLFLSSLFRSFVFTTSAPSDTACSKTRANPAAVNMHKHTHTLS